MSQAMAEAVHAATGGIPKLLRALVAQTQLTQRMSREPGGQAAVTLAAAHADPRPRQDGPVYPGTERLIDTAWGAP